MGHRFNPLWNPPVPSGRGRPPRVSRVQVVDAAVALADSDGLDAVTMRSVARTLGVGAMTLYSHVPSHEQLVDAMVDRAYADFDLPDSSLAWRPALEAYARGYWGLLRSHSWLLDLNAWRMPLAPHVFVAEDAGFGILIDTGLTPRQIVDTLTILQNAVVGAARSAAAEDADALEQGTDYATYWANLADFWEHTFDPSRFPSMARLWSTGVFDEGTMPFEMRFEGLLDTIGLLIDKAQAEGPARVPSFEECMAPYADDG